ncbi:MAG: MFS transporter [Deltaproteobacteria bacterium]|nr:MFS transporter [Deltaproteobacteria bacterium]
MTAPASTPATTTPPQPFPKVFWHANVTELFERAAYYSVASFVVIYLGQLGLGKSWPSNLNGFLWFLVYFLPILSGTIADQVGFRRSLLVACGLLACGYVLMGSPVWFFGAVLNPAIGDEMVAPASTLAPILLGILLIGIGGSVVKPCISGTVQKSNVGRATLAFAIFYMVINIGSLVGRVVAYFVRGGPSNTAPTPESAARLSFIFAVGAVAALVAFATVALLYRDPDQAPGTPTKPKKSIGEILLGMVLVLKNRRFLLFLLVSSGFWFLYNQVYNVLPLYTKRTLEANPAMDLYTAANPLTIVVFQLLITRAFGKMKPIRSIVVGTVIIALSMVANLVPVLIAGGPRMVLADWIPIGSLFIMLTVALIAFGELFTSPRTFEWIGSLAPKGQEGLFLGYANLPMAIGSLIGGPVGAWIFNDVMARDAQKLDNGLLSLNPGSATTGWLILMGIGFASALSMWLYNVWLERQLAADRAASTSPAGS